MEHCHWFEYQRRICASQVPLQPLQDNLESQTYEVFEKDTTKYLVYEEAIVQAITSLSQAPAAAIGGQAANGTDGLNVVDGRRQSPRQGRPVVVMVVGAGRGPLVRATLQASKRTGRAVRVFAVEKNPNAVITLHRMVAAQQCAARHGHWPLLLHGCRRP